MADASNASDLQLEDQTRGHEGPEDETPSISNDVDSETVRLRRGHTGKNFLGKFPKVEMAKHFPKVEMAKHFPKVEMAKHFSKFEMAKHSPGAPHRSPRIEPMMIESGKCAKNLLRD
jgi:hypothetical protein